MADDLEEGKTALIALVAALDPAVQLVIPTRSTNDRFLISLTKGKNREFISVVEDDLIELPHEAAVRREVSAIVTEGLAKLGG
jgi:hypothetical protein